MGLLGYLLSCSLFGVSGARHVSWWLQQAGLGALLVDMEGCQAVMGCMPWAWLWL